MARGRLLALALAVLLIPLLGVFSHARAQIIIATDDPTEGIWAMDVNTNQVYKALDGFGASAMAVDRANSILYFMPNTVSLWKWDYSNLSNSPEFIGTVRNPGNTSNLSVVGLGYDAVNNILYASRGLDSAAGPTGFYRVSVADASTELAFAVSNQYRFEGMDYDVSTNRFFAGSDLSPSGAGIEGIYEVHFDTNTISFLAPYPDNTATTPADLDGMAVGEGKIYLVEDKAVQAGGRIYVYNYITGEYEEPLLVPWFFSETFSAGTWAPELFEAVIPEPGAAAGLSLAALALLRRRRSSRVEVA